MPNDQDLPSSKDPGIVTDPAETFEMRMRAHEMEQLAWDGYAKSLIGILFNRARSSGSKDVRARLAADVALHADALLRERRKRFQAPGQTPPRS